MSFRIVSPAPCIGVTGMRCGTQHSTRVLGIWTQVLRHVGPPPQPKPLLFWPTLATRLCIQDMPLGVSTLYSNWKLPRNTQLGRPHWFCNGHHSVRCLMSLKSSLRRTPGGALLFPTQGNRLIFQQPVYRKSPAMIVGFDYTSSFLYSNYYKR